MSIDNVSSLRQQILLRSDSENYLLETTYSTIIITLGCLNVVPNVLAIIAMVHCLLKNHPMALELNCLLSLAYALYGFSGALRNGYLLWWQHYRGSRVMQSIHCAVIFAPELASHVFLTDCYLFTTVRFCVLLICDDRPIRSLRRRQIMATGGFLLCLLHAVAEGYIQGNTDYGKTLARCSLFGGTERLNAMEQKLRLLSISVLTLMAYMGTYVWLKCKTKRSQRVVSTAEDRVHELSTENNFGIFAFTAVSTTGFQANLTMFGIAYLKIPLNREIRVKVLVRCFAIIPHICGSLYFLAFYLYSTPFHNALRGFIKPR